SKTSSWDFDDVTAYQTITAGGGTKIYSLTFTPTQTGTYYKAVKIETNPGGKTDAWDWVTAFDVGSSTADLVVTVQNQDGSTRSGAAVVRYQGGTKIDEKTTNTSGQVTWSGLTPATYSFEAYYAGANPFDSLGELWADATKAVATGSNILTLRRDWPFTDTLRIYRVSDNVELTSGSSIPVGTPIRIEALVRNKNAASKSARALMRLDRSKTSSWDFDDVTAYQTITAGGGTKIYSLTFTPTQTGTYYKAVKIETNPGGKTDAWDWVTAFDVGSSTADLVVTVQNQDGSTRSGAAVVRYQGGTKIDEKTTNTSGQVTWSGLTPATYSFEAYYAGANPFDSLGELWADATKAVATGSNILTLRRDWPFTDTLRIYRVSDNVELTSGSSIPVGTPIRIEALVRNKNAASKSARALMRLDRSKTSSWDFDDVTAYQTITAGGGTKIYSLTFTPTQTGTYYKAVKIETNPGGKTDAWDWVTAFDVGSSTADLVVTVQNQDGSTRSGAAVVRYQGGTKIDEKTTNTSGQVTWSGLTPATYSFEAYYAGANPFDSLGELWADATKAVATGSNILTLRRDWPFTDTLRIYRVSDNVELTSGSSIPVGTPIRIEALVRNKNAASKSARALMRLDRSKTSSWDFDDVTAYQTITAGGGTKIYSLTFTPTQTGTYYKAVKIETNPGGKTDAWDWVTAFDVGSSTADLVVTVQNQDGSTRSGAAVVRYQGGTKIDEKTTNTSGQVTWSGLTPATYSFEAYYAGANPFDSLGELWADATKAVATGSNILTLRRDWPFTDTLRIYRVSDNVELTSGSSIPVGTPIRIEALVRNKNAASKSARALMRLDRSKTSSWDFDDVTAYQTITAGGGTKIYSLTFTPTQTGTYYKAVKIETNPGGKTDAWDWVTAFDVGSSTADLVVTVQNQDGSNRSGAAVVRYQGGAKIDEKTTDGAGQVTWAGMAIGTYSFEAYFKGVNAFDSLGELWADATKAVATGSNTLTLRRDWPFAQTLRVYRVSDNLELKEGSSIAVGTPIRIEALVRNKNAASRSARALLRLDRDKAPLWDVDLTTAYQTLTSNGDTTVYDQIVTPTETGTYYAAVKIEVSPGGKTDAWDWQPSFAMTT